MGSAPPSSALIPLLLLLAAPRPGSGCSFSFNPVSSTFRAHLNKLGKPHPGSRNPPDSSPPRGHLGPPEPPHQIGLSLGTPRPLLQTPWLLLDYPVAMPSNLEPDSGCSHLWGLHFGAAALKHMEGVAGKDLAPLLSTFIAHLSFVSECHIQDPQGCVRLETVNVSQLLETLVQHLGELQGRPLHFPGCAHLRCRPGPPLTTPAVQHEGTVGSRQGPPHPGGHGLALLGGLGGALGLAVLAWVLWRRPCAQSPPVSEQDGT